MQVYVQSFTSLFWVDFTPAPRIRSCLSNETKKDSSPSRIAKAPKPKPNHSSENSEGFFGRNVFVFIFMYTNIDP